MRMRKLHKKKFGNEHINKVPKLLPYKVYIRNRVHEILIIHSVQFYIQENDDFLKVKIMKATLWY